MGVVVEDCYIKDQLFLETVVFSKNNPFCLFIHGGPGMNSFTASQFIQQSEAYAQGNFNFIFYDQRGCGRSKTSESGYTHSENVDDLKMVLDFCSDYHVQTIVGHSYGAMLLYDCVQKHSDEIDQNLVFLSVSSHIMTPRLNNLLLDLKFLKKEIPEMYEESLAIIERGFTPDTIDEVTNKLMPYFARNPKRVDYYWADSTAQDAYLSIVNPYGMSLDVFNEVRSDFYGAPRSYKLDFDSVNNSKWIVGFHDYIMGGNTFSEEGSGKTTFYRSGHYPHIEEPHKFLESLANWG